MREIKKGSANVTRNKDSHTESKAKKLIVGQVNEDVFIDGGNPNDSNKNIVIKLCS